MHELAPAPCRMPRASLGVVEHQSDRRATFPLLLCPLLAPPRTGTRDRHGRAPSSPVPRLFSPLSPPRSSRATPSASPPSPTRRARARRPKPCWEHRSRRPPSPPTAGAHGRSTSGRLSAIRDHQRARAGPLVLPRHSTAAGDGYGCRSHEPAGLSVLPSEAEKTKDFALKLEESEGVK